MHSGEDSVRTKGLGSCLARNECFPRIGCEGGDGGFAV